MISPAPRWTRMLSPSMPPLMASHAWHKPFFCLQSIAILIFCWGSELSWGSMLLRVKEGKSTKPWPKSYFKQGGWPYTLPCRQCVNTAVLMMSFLTVVHVLWRFSVHTAAFPCITAEAPQWNFVCCAVGLILPYFHVVACCKVVLICHVLLRNPCKTFFYGCCCPQSQSFFWSLVDHWTSLPPFYSDTYLLLSSWHDWNCDLVFKDGITGL